jgi:hypothetical protein
MNYKMDGNTVIFPDSLIKADRSENSLEVMFNDYLVEIEVGHDLIQFTRTQLIGLLAMMDEMQKQR